MLAHMSVTFGTKWRIENAQVPVKTSKGIGKWSIRWQQLKLSAWKGNMVGPKFRGSKYACGGLFSPSIEDARGSDGVAAMMKGEVATSFCWLRKVLDVVSAALG